MRASEKGLRRWQPSAVLSVVPSVTIYLLLECVCVALVCGSHVDAFVGHFVQLSSSSFVLCCGPSSRSSECVCLPLPFSPTKRRSQRRERGRKQEQEEGMLYAYRFFSPLTFPSFQFRMSVCVCVNSEDYLFFPFLQMVTLLMVFMRENTL